MLYIWPYTVFFSAPILYPYFLNLFVPQQWVPSTLRSASIKQRFPRILIALLIIAIMLAIAHYNTIVHPFTLADNRHFTFYVFRILRRHWSLKYLAIPIYYLCAWSTITALGEPFTQPSSQAGARRVKQPHIKSSSPIISTTSPEQGQRANFLLIYLLATSASLITAPLVEPRYFIVPWLMWRLQIASSLPNAPVVRSGEPAPKDKAANSWTSHDHRLWLETVWFLLVNAGVGYAFLYRGFEWAQEPGVVQRFMW